MQNIANLGCELVEVTYRKNKFGEMDLTLYVNKDGGVTLDDCERISLAIDPIIETSGIMGDEEHNLNVSSLGADWPASLDADF
ncbi:MAG: ribosome maturation factor RimP [Firmicutes bacterium]|nr:ribosome maturation factor RimP [Bacillota bacterium]